jgi:hypothetical protein
VQIRESFSGETHNLFYTPQTRVSFSKRKTNNMTEQSQSNIENQTVHSEVKTRCSKNDRHPFFTGERFSTFRSLGWKGVAYVKKTNGKYMI